MLSKATRMHRRRMGLIRNVAIVAAFAATLHFAHRECARSTVPPRPERTEPAAATSGPAQPADSEAPAGAHAQDFHATAYCITGLTRAGVPVAPGHVAADPKVIPLGSVIHVESPFMSGIYQVMDTGAAIKGRIIDIFMPSYEDCIEFGRRAVKVKVLRYGFKGKPSEQSSEKEPSE